MVYSIDDKQLQNVDHAALRTNQAVIILLNLAAFIANAPWLTALVAVFMLLGTALRLSGFGFIYKFILKPTELVKPDVLPDNPEPHRFAQGFGGVVMAGSAAFLFVGASLPGWALTFLVIALAALNFLGGFCVGCAVYYWMNRMNIPGFHRSPMGGTTPGMRPSKELR